MPDVNVIVKRLVKNSLAGFLRYVITAPIILVVTPYILHHLGAERFGVWALFGIVTAFADLSDLGIASGLVRYVARGWVAGDEQAVNRSVSTVLVIYLLTGGGVTAAILLGGGFIAATVLKIPAAFLDEAVFVITGAAIAFFVSLLSGIFGSLLQGLQRMDLWNASLVAYAIMDAVGAVILLALGYGLSSLVLSRILSCLITGLLNYKFVHKLIPTLKCRPAYFSLKSGREIIGYSLNILVSKVMSMAREPLSKTILLQIASLSGVTFFDLGARLANQARGVFVAMLVPLLPAAAGVQTVGGIRATRQLYYQSTRYIFLLVFPVFGVLIVLAKPIIDAWIGSEYGLVVLTLQGLLVGNFFAILSSPAYTIMEGVGLAKVSAGTSVVSAVLSVGLSIGLGLHYGYMGVLTGYCLAIIITSAVTLALFHRVLAVPLSEFLHAMPYRAVLVDCSVMMASWLLVIHAHLSGVFVLLIIGLIYIAFCAFGTLVSGSLSIAEVRTMKRLFVAFIK